MMENGPLYGAVLWTPGLIYKYFLGNFAIAEGIVLLTYPNTKNLELIFY